MDPPASFSSLPPELIAKICGDSGLEKKDLVALRLTSKTQDVHASATKAFSKRYFSDVKLLCNNDSLETFVKICQHPIFGPSIQRIQLSCAHYDFNDFNDTVDDIQTKGLDHHGFLGQVRILSERCDAETYQSHLASALLERAFVHLAQSNRSFILAVSTDEEQSVGYSKIWWADMSPSWYADPSAALGLLLNAARKSGCDVRKIEVQATAEYNLGDHVFTFDDPELGRSLSELTFYLWANSSGSTEHDLGLMKNLLSLAANLKSLHIETNVFNREDDFVPLAQSISRLPLEELHLTCVYMCHELMTDLLKSLGPTLCRLKMSRCNIAGSWKQILLSIQQHALQLDKLHIEGNARMFFQGTVEYECTTNVRMGVAGLLQFGEDMAEAYWPDDDLDGW
jgi:hypothetical protein